MAEAGPTDQVVEDVRAGYALGGPCLELGALVHGGSAVPDAPVRIPLSVFNRHGLVAGATGTGKTKTLQLMAEQLSTHGVPVFAADVKGTSPAWPHPARRATRSWPERPRSVRNGKRGPARSSCSPWVAPGRACRCVRRSRRSARRC